MGADAAPRPLERIGVLGAGTMGAGIAQLAAEAGIDVAVYDAVAGAYERGHERTAGFLARKVEKGQLSEPSRAAALARITQAADVEALATADLVIEAIPEDLDLKRDAFRRLDAAARENTILASNTSSLSIGAIAEATNRPGRVVGMHFFNPVPLMALVEVIASERTGREFAEATMAAARRLDKTPVLAADTPGFIVNRVARPFYLEAMRIAGEGSATIGAVDAAARGIGFRMGPFELVDTIGADVNLAVSQSVYEAFDRDPRYEPHEMQRALVDAGRLGRKAGAGFYDYSPDGAREASWSGLTSQAGESRGEVLTDAQIAGRLLATIVNEAASAVADEVAAPEAIDTAMRLGANYPSGPLEWGERIGLSEVVETLDSLAAASADGRYRVVPILRSRAESGGSFFTSRG